MALPMMCFSWVKPIEVFCVMLQEAKTSRKRSYGNKKLVGSITTRYCIVKTIFIPYLVNFHAAFIMKYLFQEHGIWMKKNEVFKTPAKCGQHEK